MRLDVAVQQAPVVGGLQRAADLHSDLQHLRHRQRPVLLDPLTERAAAVELHHDARLLGVGERGVEHRDDVRVLGHQPHRPALPLEAAPLALVDQAEGEHLQCDAPVEVPLPGAEDVAEPTPADRPEVIEPVDVDGRDRGIDSSWHGRGERHGWAGTDPHRIVARRGLAYGQSSLVGAVIGGGQGDQFRLVAPSTGGAAVPRRK